ncbi:MAG: GFA family protein [Rhodobiaceae bacterium]|nr:GFA family protein [Rhodobiaceae bacterium]
MIEGGCLCGSVRYKSSAAPIVMRACWCRLCQYIAAGSATINLAFQSDAVTVTGELRDYASTADSGHRMHRQFCPACGTHMFSEADERPHLIIVRGGTLDDPDIVKLDATIWSAEAPCWAHLDPDIETYEGQPPPAA